MAAGPRPPYPPPTRPTTIGLPFHGKVSGGDPDNPTTAPGTLVLPSAATRNYPQPSDGGCVMVQHPKHAAPVRTAIETADDDAKDYRWQQYALLSGYKHQIAGHELGQDYHFYCDANYTWRIRIKQTARRGSCTVQVYLSGLFGMLSDTDYAMSERLLAEATWSPVNENGNTMPTATLGGYSVRSFSKTGTKALLMVGTYYQSALQYSGLMPVRTQHQDYDGTIYCHDVVRVTISGNGSIAQGNVGSGITAAIVQWSPLPYATFAEQSEGEGVGDLTVTRDRTQNYLFVTTPAGSETTLTKTKTTVFVQANGEWETYESGSSLVACDVNTTASELVEFGGGTISGAAEYVGTFDAYASPKNSGTLTVNGVGVPWSSTSSEPASPNLDDYALLSVYPALPLAVSVWPLNGTPGALFADGSSQSTTIGATEQQWAYDPGGGGFSTATGTVSYV